MEINHSNMIDGINCRVVGDSYKNIVNNNQLLFKESYNQYQAVYKGLRIIIYKESMICYLRGSIHLYKNNNSHNADLFTYQDFLSSINKLKSELHINIRDLQIMRLEIGINLPLTYPPERYLNTISEIQNVMPTKKRKSLTVEYTQYKIKVYSKSHQYREFKDLNILRIEIAYLKKQKLTQDLGELFMFDDLLDYSIWKKITKVLMTLVRKFVFFDFSEITTNDLTIDEALTFYEWSNAVRIAQEPDRSKVSRKRKKVNEIYHKYAENRKAKELIELMNEKLEESLNF